jgi:hypothetical protein
MPGGSDDSLGVGGMLAGEDSDFDPPWGTSKANGHSERANLERYASRWALEDVLPHVQKLRNFAASPAVTACREAAAFARWPRPNQAR